MCALKKAAWIAFIFVFILILSACGRNLSTISTVDSISESVSEAVGAKEPDPAPGDKASVSSAQEPVDDNPEVSADIADEPEAEDESKSSSASSEASREIRTNSESANTSSPNSKKSDSVEADTVQNNPAPGGDGMYTVNITIGSDVFTAKYYDNESSRVLIDQMPMTLQMGDYAGQEKVINLPYDFPSASTERPDTIRAGEIYLWSGNSLVLFYTTFSNSYGGYVPIGYIEDTAGLTAALGGGSVSVTFSIP